MDVDVEMRMRIRCAEGEGEEDVRRGRWGGEGEGGKRRVLETVLGEERALEAGSVKDRNRGGRVVGWMG